MIKECDGCGYKAEVTKIEHIFIDWYETEKTERKKEFYFCDICKNTIIGSAAMYPQNYKGNLAIIRLLGYLANAIIDHIENK